MNGYLLDTHALLWWLDDPTKIVPAAREVIADASHAVYASAVVAWEIAIESALGRLDVPDDLPGVLKQAGIDELSITVAHGLAVGTLPDHHQDPFDRMLVAQANVEQLVLVTRDAAIKQYGVSVLDA